MSALDYNDLIHHQFVYVKFSEGGKFGGSMFNEAGELIGKIDCPPSPGCVYYVRGDLYEKVYQELKALKEKA